MKKILSFFVAAFVATTVSAQTVTESKTFDNFYISINGGVATKMKGHAWMKDLNADAGLRIGRWFTPVFGLAADGNVYFGDQPHPAGSEFCHGTIARMVNTSLLGTVNFTKWFGGYPGEPRVFEVVGLYGLGWAHTFNNKGWDPTDHLTSKAGLDLVFNLGSSKAWQFFVEPAVVWALNGNGYEGVKYDIHNSFFQLNGGFTYKFLNSNGTHNFTVARLRDQAEIDALNAQINDLRNELAKKPKEIIKEVEVIKEVPGKNVVHEVKVEDLVFVTFAQGKSELTADARAALNNIKEGRHVQIVGTASPEGNPELNQKLSQARADAVAQYLLTRGVAVDEATGKGVQGTTSNRLAVVYVK